MAMTAWSANVSSSAIWLSVNGALRLLQIVITPMASPSEHRNADHGPEARADHLSPP